MSPGRLLRITRLRKPRAHLLHVRKTGGTAIKAALRPVLDAGPYQIMLHSHEIDLRQIPPGDMFFFAVRDPVDRFISGFRSRQRRGRPRYDFPWTAGEERAFQAFASADALGSALSSDNSQKRAAARDAMISISHVRDSYWQWFHDRDYLESRLDDLLFVMPFADLNVSFAQLRELLGLPDSTVLPTDDVAAHRGPRDGDRHLGDRAAANLREWYGADLAFIDLCTTFDRFAKKTSTPS